MEVLFLVIIIGLLAANLYFVTKKDAPEDEKNDEYLIKGIVSEIIENEESGYIILKMVEIIGEKELAELDDQTLNLIIEIMNRTKLISLRKNLIKNFIP